MSRDVRNFKLPNDSGKDFNELLYTLNSFRLVKSPMVSGSSVNLFR